MITFYFNNKFFYFIFHLFVLFHNSSLTYFIKLNWYTVDRSLRCEHDLSIRSTFEVPGDHRLEPLVEKNIEIWVETAVDLNERVEHVEPFVKCL